MVYSCQWGLKSWDGRTDEPVRPKVISHFITISAAYQKKKNYWFNLAGDEMSLLEKWDRVVLLFSFNITALWPSVLALHIAARYRILTMDSSDTRYCTSNQDSFPSAKTNGTKPNNDLNEDHTVNNIKHPRGGPASCIFVARYPLSVIVLGLSYIIMLIICNQVFPSYSKTLSFVTRWHNILHNGALFWMLKFLETGCRGLMDLSNLRLVDHIIIKKKKG